MVQKTMTMFPDLSDSKIISFDIETKDPELTTAGPGVYRRDGYICGVGIATDSGFSQYYDLAHPGPKMYAPEKVLDYLREVLALPVPKVAVNAMYDLDWLTNGHDQDGKPYGFNIAGRVHDIQAAEPLIDENRRTYTLDSLAEKYLKQHKTDDEIRAYCELQGWKGDPRVHLWRMTAAKVKSYGIGDVELPIQILRKQLSVMSTMGLRDLYEIEIGQFPLLLQMRRAGVRVDEAKRTALVDEFTAHLDTCHKRLNELAGFEVNYMAVASVKKALTAAGIPIPVVFDEKSGTHKETTGKDFLAVIDHDVPQLVMECRQTRKLVKDFLIGSLSNAAVDGRIHGSFNPLRSDQYGTVSGRYSGSNPNLQQIPRRTEAGNLIRTAFIPEEGHGWNKTDYSQIEVRALANIALGTGAADFVRQYRDDPRTDYHTWTASVVFNTPMQEVTKAERSAAKTINFGIMFGMGKAKICRSLGTESEEGERIYNAYHAALPFVKDTSRAIQRKAETRGWIRTILHRRRNFPYGIDKDGKRRRLGTYRALNAYTQGSGADILKKAMMDLHKAGIYDVLVPHLTVHDELDDSYPKTAEGREAVMEKKHIMENAVKLRVPVVADVEIGPSWGEVTDITKGWNDES